MKKPSTDGRERQVGGQDPVGGKRQAAAPQRGELVASYAASPVKIYGIAAMLVLLIVLGLHRLLTTPAEGEDLLAALFLIGLPSAVLLFTWKDARRRGALVFVHRNGFIDERQPAIGFVSWQRLRGGDIRRQLLGQGLRVEFPDGTKMDIDLTLLDARPSRVLRTMREGLRGHADGRERR